MAATRTTVNINWSLQRSHHGEQPFWALVTLACMLGQIGLPGGGFGVGYGPANLMGSAHPALFRPDPAAGHQRGERLHPGRALHRHAAQSRRQGLVQRPRAHLPRHPPGLLGGRQSVPSPPGPQPAARRPGASPRPSCSTSSSGRRPRAWPTSCCRPPPRWSATTSATAGASRILIAMKKAREPIGEARDDYWIFSEIARRLGNGDGLHRRPRHHGVAGAPLRAVAREVGQSRRDLPAVRRLLGGRHRRGGRRDPRAGHAGGLPRRSRQATRSRRRRAGSRSSPRRSPRSATTTAPATRPGSSRSNGWAARRPSAIRCTCCRTSRPTSCTASSTTARMPARPRSRAASRSRSIPTTRPRAASPTAICCACSTIAAPASRRRDSSDRIRRGVVRLSTGAWFDPADAGSNRPLEKHGNPNALTLDIGASKLSQGCIAQTCLVEIERFDGPAPARDGPPAAGVRGARFALIESRARIPSASALAPEVARPATRARRDRAQRAHFDEVRPGGPGEEHVQRRVMVLAHGDRPGR